VKVEPRRVEKPWGYEIIWADSELYVGKILHVNAGEALSVQMHRRKDETMYLLSGEVRLWVGDESYRIAPGTVHLMEAVADSDVLEASTPHLDDLVRFRDRYGRSAKDG
jgi:mannose-6-phosphate isomerase-like protein (cupin superfamily)